MTGAAICPFCAGENDGRAVVCNACHRDIVIPASLNAEYQELLLKREQLRAELDRTRAAIGALRRGEAGAR
jgi:hypothetical protein